MTAFWAGVLAGAGGLLLTIVAGLAYVARHDDPASGGDWRFRGSSRE
jgi:hypothetical protein